MMWRVWIIEVCNGAEQTVPLPAGVSFTTTSGLQTITHPAIRRPASEATSDNTYKAHQPLTFLIEPAFPGHAWWCMGFHGLYHSELRKLGLCSFFYIYIYHL